MKFWLKTANVNRALECLNYGIFEGIISNPADVSQENIDPKKLFKALCEVAPKVYYQIQDGSVEEMTKEAEDMVGIEPDKMLIKVPATRNGYGCPDKPMDDFYYCGRSSCDIALQRDAEKPQHYQ